MSKKKTEDQSTDGTTTSEEPALALAESVAPPATQSPMMASLLGAARAHFGGDLYVGSEAERIMMGLEPYGLALQWLIDSNIIPIPCVMQLSGPAKSYKTSAMIEFCRPFLHAGGAAMISHTEGKFSSSKGKALLREEWEKVMLKDARSTQDWQNNVSWTYNWLMAVKAELEKNNASEKTKGKPTESGMTYVPPLIHIVDSVTGNQSDESTDKVMSSGEGFGRAFPERAMVITTFLNTLPANMRGIPMLVFLTNHLKTKIDGVSIPGIPPAKYNPGGVALGYHVSLDIRVRRGKDNTAGGVTTIELHWEVNFSSIGRDGRRLMIPYVEGYDEAGNQVDAFDWDASFVYMWLDLQKQETNYPGLKDILHIVPQQNDKAYSCKQLGIKPDDAITASELGRIIQMDLNWRQAVQKGLRIQKHQVWHPAIELPKIPKEEKKDKDKKKK
jgi:hypothetical protein